MAEGSHARIHGDSHAAAQLGQAWCSGFSWLAERLYYLAATDVAPFADQQVLVDTLTEIWTAVIYGPASMPPSGSRRTKPSPRPPPPAL
jgi:hypothetical protein